jgi:5,10-methylene-tetrahydrofolate dehydrogenase/methenyl tetrahydrofolate cyclohydrolase
LNILDGKETAAAVRERVRQQVEQLEGSRPVIALVQVGEDPASNVYVRTKVRMSD